jgi:hypothetical protein
MNLALVNILMIHKSQVCYFNFIAKTIRIPILATSDSKQSSKTTTEMNEIVLLDSDDDDDDNDDMTNATE